MPDNKIIKTQNKENIKITRNEFYNILEDYLKQNKKLNISYKNFILYGNKIYNENNYIINFKLMIYILKMCIIKLKKRYLI